MQIPSLCCAIHLLPFILSLIHGVQGGTLREHRLSEPRSYEPVSQLRPPPSAEMLRALRYIQSLSQRTPYELPVDDHQPTTTDLEPDDIESVRSVLRQTAPARGSTGMDRDVEERDNTQQWLQAVLTTLQQTEEQIVPQKTPQKPPTQPLPRPKQQLAMETSWGNPGIRRRHGQYPLIFDNEEDQPLKRTNENAEEQYTPQKLATLQSVFEELSGISSAKTNNKRDDDDDDEDDDGLYKQRKMALEDLMGTDEWEPLEEQTETEEEQRERHGFNRKPDDEVKRSNQREKEEPDDITKLVDLLKLLERTEEEQKREEVNGGEQEEQTTDRELEKKDAEKDDDDDDVDEERDEEEREIKSEPGSFPQSLSQLIKISQKLQIPPADVLDLLRNEQRDFKTPQRAQAQSRTPQRAYTTTHNAHTSYAAAPHQRPLQTSESNSAVQDILRILELVSAAQLNDKRPTQPKPSRYYERERDLPAYGFTDSSRDDYDDTTGEDDELASFLASEMLAKGQRRARLQPEQQSVYGKLERAVQDYFDQNVPEKRPVEHKSAPSGSDDDDRMMRILRYLEPDNDETDEIDSEGKTVPEM
nr:secretogranin-2a [Misgurnus anguillicaudatus]